MTSLMPHSALNAERPPSVVIAMMGQPIPVVVMSFVKDLAAGSSRRASMSRTSTYGASTRTDASAGKMRTVCWSKPSAGKTSALAP